MRAHAAYVLLIVLGCKDPAPSTPDASAPTASHAPSHTASAEPAPTPTPTREAELPPPPSDAGAGACKVIDGPTKLARPGPFTAVSRMGFVDFYAQDHGAPALAGSVKVDARGSAPTGNAPPVSPAERSAVPACASAGTTHVFCTNAAGEVRRYRLGSDRVESDNFVARARPGSPVAAALVSGHTLVAYLRDRTTSEGNVTEAYVESDDGTETRLSEDGAGATSIALASRGTDAVAAYVDARRAMSPVHARVLTASPKLALGKDAVLFVAGTAETYTRVTLGVRGHTAYALLPVAHDLAFGQATVKIDGDPKVDSPVTWSEYPNGLDPAPIAATISADSSSVMVARVRPSAAKFGSPRVLELGSIDASSAFVPFGVVPTEGTPIDVAIAGDGASGVVIAYTGYGGGWSERLNCASK